MVTWSDPMHPINRSSIIECITNAGVFIRNDLPGTSLRPAESESPYWDGDDQSGSEDWGGNDQSGEQSGSDSYSPYFDCDF